ncbi:MAG TPA: response regulator [Desulfuromonadales bacterium]|nr:response regulator [Desulfuromonadales bacterium]
MAVALIADDESLIRRQVSEILTDYGFAEIVEAADGAEAVALADAKKPVLIIMDVSMPVLDGISAAEKIIKNRAVPIVMLTGTGDAETVDRARATGIMNYIMKPVHSEQLHAAVSLAVHQFVEVSSLREEVEKLKESLETRKLVDRAKALLINNGLSEPEAYRKMQKIAMDKRKSMKQVAEAILLMEG